MQATHKHGGWTLSEILLAVSIIAMVALISAPVLLSSIRNDGESPFNATVATLSHGLNLASADLGLFPLQAGPAQILPAQLNNTQTLVNAPGNCTPDGDTQHIQLSSGVIVSGLSQTWDNSQDYNDAQPGNQAGDVVCLALNGVDSRPDQIRYVALARTSPHVLMDSTPSTGINTPGPVVANADPETTNTPGAGNPSTTGTPTNPPNNNPNPNPGNSTPPPTTTNPTPTPRDPVLGDTNCNKQAMPFIQDNLMQQQNFLDYLANSRGPNPTAMPQFIHNQEAGVTPVGRRNSYPPLNPSDVLHPPELSNTSTPLLNSSTHPHLGEKLTFSTHRLSWPRPTDSSFEMSINFGYELFNQNDAGNSSDSHYQSRCNMTVQVSFDSNGNPQVDYSSVRPGIRTEESILADGYERIKKVEGGNMDYEVMRFTRRSDGGEIINPNDNFMANVPPGEEPRPQRGWNWHMPAIGGSNINGLIAQYDTFDLSGNLVSQHSYQTLQIHDNYYSSASGTSSITGFDAFENRLRHLRTYTSYDVATGTTSQQQFYIDSASRRNPTTSELLGQGQVVNTFNANSAPTSVQSAIPTVATFSGFDDVRPWSDYTDATGATRFLNNSINALQSSAGYQNGDASASQYSSDFPHIAPPHVR